MNHPRRTLLAATGLALIAPHLAVARDEVVRGPGRIVGESRDVGPFDEVALSGSFDVEIRQAARGAVALSGDERLLPLVETVVRETGSSRTLDVRLRRGTWTEGTAPVKVTIDVVRLAAIDLGGVGNVVGKGLRTGKLAVALGGAGRVRLEGLDADHLAVTVAGSGQVVVDGRAGGVKVVIAGHGTCDTDGLAAGDVAVTIAGSGDAHVRADRTLAVSIAGSGDVSYRGDAVPTTSIVGSGRVRKV